MLIVASVAPYVDRSDPPILLAYGTDDRLVEATTQGAPLAQVWLDAHDGDPNSTTYWAIERAGHTLPSTTTPARSPASSTASPTPARPSVRCDGLDPHAIQRRRLSGRAHFGRRMHDGAKRQCARCSLHAEHRKTCSVVGGSTGAPGRRMRTMGPKPPTVVLSGDSLGFESQTYFRDALVDAGITDVHTKTFGGTALCDWIDDMRADAEDLRPTSVVIEFSGNAFTPCMHDAVGNPLTGDAYYTKYRDDAAEALAIFASTHTVLYSVGTPVSRRAAVADDPNAGRLNRVYASLASRSGGRYIDAGAAVLDHGAWTRTLPCRIDEPCEGGTDHSGNPVNVVRADDGMHFCPAAPDAIRGVTGDCPVWSSGAYRFATAMAAPIIRDSSSR